MINKINKTDEWLKKEEMRLKALYEYDLINIEMKELDSITRILSIISRVPISSITVIDRNYYYVKSKVGCVPARGDRTLSFSQWTLEQDDIFEIKNSVLDERFKDIPKGEPPVLYYAGIPLKTLSGYNIGVLNVADYVPRELNEDQRMVFTILAKHLVMQFELAKFNKELKIATEKANKLAKAKDEFLSNMSHEIRTPLNAIYGFTELLNKTHLDKNQQEMVNIVKTSVDILMAIINDILDFSKIESGKLNIDNFPFNIEDVLKGLKELFSKRATEKNLLLNFFLNEKIPKIINGDRNRINQILINLIANSIKFTNKGFINVSLDLADEDKDKIGIKFSVEDTGIGIEKEKQPYIFERFEQASNETSRKYGGTGLGLSICKNLVELQGGDIKLKSELGSGTNFYFTLFFNKLEQSKINDFIKNEIKQNENKMQSNKSDKQFFNENIKKILKKEKIEILVCEDTVFNFRLLQKIFEDTIVKLNYAENGKIGLDKFEEKSDYDLILLDLQMPIMDGFQFATILRNEKKSDVVILALTANNSEREKVKCLDIGMNGYLTKPFKQKDLLETIINVFSLRNNDSNKSLDKEYLKIIDDYNNNNKNNTKNNSDLTSKSKDGQINKKEAIEPNENIDPNVSATDKRSNHKFREKKKLIENFSRYLQDRKNNRLNALSAKRVINLENSRIFEEDLICSETGDNNQILSLHLKKNIVKPYNSNTKIDPSSGQKYSKCHYKSECSLNLKESNSSLKSQMREKKPFNHNSCFTGYDFLNEKKKHIMQHVHYNKDNLNNKEDLESKKNKEELNFNKNFNANLYRDNSLTNYKEKVKLDHINNQSNENKQECSNTNFTNGSISKESEIAQYNDSLISDTITDSSSFFNTKISIASPKMKKESFSKLTIPNTGKDHGKEKTRKKSIQNLRRCSSNTQKNKNSKFLSNTSSLINKLNKQRNDERECGLVLIDFEKDKSSELFTKEEIKDIAINYENLNEISGGDYFIEKDLISIFMQEFRQKISNLKNALKNYDLKTIQIIAHALKSNVAILGIESLRSKFLQIEQAVKNICKENKVIQIFRNKMDTLDVVFLKLKDDLLDKYKDLDITGV